MMLCKYDVTVWLLAFAGLEIPWLDGWMDGVYGAGMGFSVWAMKHTIPCSRNLSPISQYFIGREDVESNSTCGCRRPIMDGSRVFNSKLSNQVSIYPTINQFLNSHPNVKPVHPAASVRAVTIHTITASGIQTPTRQRRLTTLPQFSLLFPSLISALLIFPATMPPINTIQYTFRPVVTAYAACGVAVHHPPISRSPTPPFTPSSLRSRKRWRTN